MEVPLNFVANVCVALVVLDQNLSRPGTHFTFINLRNQTQWDLLDLQCPTHYSIYASHYKSHRHKLSIPLTCAQEAQTAAAPAASVLATPPPPPVTFASNNNNGGGSSNGAFSSSIGDVFTYKPSTGGSIESAGGAGPITTALTTNNGALSLVAIFQVCAGKALCRKGMCL